MRKSLFGIKMRMFPHDLVFKIKMRIFRYKMDRLSGKYVKKIGKLPPL